MAPPRCWENFEVLLRCGVFYQGTVMIIFIMLWRHHILPYVSRNEMCSFVAIGGKRPDSSPREVRRDASSNNDFPGDSTLSRNTNTAAISEVFLFLSRSWVWRALGLSPKELTICYSVPHTFQNFSDTIFDRTFLWSVNTGKSAPACCRQNSLLRYKRAAEGVQTGKFR